jgi:hypothetical protein
MRASRSLNHCATPLMNLHPPENPHRLQLEPLDSRSEKWASNDASIISKSSGHSSQTENVAHRDSDVRMESERADCADTSRSGFDLDYLANCKRSPKQRFVVVHSYRDHLHDPVLRPSPQAGQGSQNRIPFQVLVPSPSTSYVHCSEYKKLIFPEKLHFMLHQLEKEGLQHVCCWKPHGRCFLVGDKKAFATTVASR